MNSGARMEFEEASWSSATARRLFQHGTHQVKVVNNFIELKEAIREGANIEIQSHIDMRENEALPVLSNTRLVRVRVSSTRTHFEVFKF